MAFLVSKPSFHARSTSFPSRPHPIAEQVEEHLCRLRSSETASTSSSSVNHKLSILGDLYACVDELLLMPSNQQIIAQDCQSTWVDDVLDGSLRLLDICSTARDALLQTKEQIQNIQSALRRRVSGELTIATEIAQYLNARKSVKKAIKNRLKDMKKIAGNDDIDSIKDMLNNVTVVTAEVFKSVLIHITDSKMQSKKNSWSLVKSLVHHQKSDTEATTSISKFEDVDASLSSLVTTKKNTGINMMQVDNLTSQLGELETEIHVLDEALQSLFRKLVKSRATLLNIISN